MPDGSQRRSRTAVTLLELIVAIAVGTIVFGIAAAGIIETDQTARRVIQREALRQQAMAAMHQIRALLEQVVWSDDLADRGDESPRVAFAHDSLTVFSSYDPTSGGAFCRYSVGYRMEAPGEKSEPGILRFNPGATQASEFRDLGGEYEMVVSFLYATAFDPDRRPVWRESLSGGEKPALIWFEVVLRDPELRGRKGALEQIRLQSAVAL
jgi:hypothetical protein